MLKKRKIVELKIQKMAFPNKGIGYFENNEVIIKNTLEGQRVLANIIKHKGVYKGKLIKVLEKSEKEITPLCFDFANCGGCTYQNLSYEDELKIKEQMVLNTLDDFNIKVLEYEGIEPASDYMEYRNKMEYSFGDECKNGKLALGMRKRDSYYEVVTAKKCNIVDSDYRQVLKCVLNFFQNTDEKFYHKMSHLGSLRHLVVRKGFFTGQIIVNIVTNDSLNTDLIMLVKSLLNLELEGKIVGIYHTVNNSVADAVKCDGFKVLYGQDFYMEKILGLHFKISPFSFFQTNSVEAQKLYSTVRRFAGNLEGLNVFDLYCGTGTITQIFAKYAKKAVGVEIIEQAVINARLNAELNGIHNCTFINGDVLKVVDGLDVKPDIIVLDPPRDGINPKAINKIISYNADKIIYISCKPTSLARDLQLFIESGYNVIKFKMHDLFPRTYHVECVVLMTRKDG